MVYFVYLEYLCYRIFCYHILCCYVTIVSLSKTVPSNGYPVCPGQTIVYECITTSADVIWQENGFSAPFLPSDTDPKTLERFEFQIMSANESTIVSTATLSRASSNDSGTLIACIEDECIQNEVVQVAS